MSNASKALIAGFVATLVLSVLIILNGTTGLMPQIDIILLLTKLGTLTVAAAWMDHFIIGVVVWGLLFAAFDAIARSRAVDQGRDFRCVCLADDDDGVHAFGGSWCFRC